MLARSPLLMAGTTAVRWSCGVATTSSSAGTRRALSGPKYTPDLRRLSLNGGKRPVQPACSALAIGHQMQRRAFCWRMSSRRLAMKAVTKFCGCVAGAALSPRRRPRAISGYGYPGYGSGGGGSAKSSMRHWRGTSYGNGYGAYGAKQHQAVGQCVGAVQQRLSGGYGNNYGAVTALMAARKAMALRMATASRTVCGRRTSAWHQPC